MANPGREKKEMDKYSDIVVKKSQMFNSTNKYSAAQLNGKTVYKGAPERLLVNAKKCIDKNGNISKGVSFAQKDLEKAQKQLKEKLTSTQSYYECAQKSAEEIIINLVKNLNPEATELTVELEFIDW